MNVDKLQNETNRVNESFYLSKIILTKNMAANKLLQKFFDDYEDKALKLTTTEAVNHFVALKPKHKKKKLLNGLNTFRNHLHIRKSHPYVINKFLDSDGLNTLYNILKSCLIESKGKKQSQSKQSTNIDTIESCFKLIITLIDCESLKLYDAIINYYYKTSNLLSLLIPNYETICLLNGKKDNCQLLKFYFQILSKIAIYSTISETQAFNCMF